MSSPIERGAQFDRKIVILGQQGVGKSSLVLRYVNQTFQENGASTIGASFLAKKVQVDDTTVRLQIWDTAGQERFRSMYGLHVLAAES
jgi:small GTP-binding protein